MAVEQQVREFESLVELLEDLENKGIRGQRRKSIVFAYLGDQAKAKERPIVASFELTPLCNFDCKMCYIHLSKTQIEPHSLLSVDQWKHIIDMSIDAGIMAADLTGGECLTYPGFKEIYLHLWERGIQPCVLTNGSLLNDSYVDFFAHHPPQIIQISVYGSNEDAYHEVTGHHAFHDVMSGIQRLQAARLPVHLVITPNRYMENDADHLLNHLRSLGIPYSIGGVSLPARPDTNRHICEYAMDVHSFAQLQKNEVEYQQRQQTDLNPHEFYPLRMSALKNREGAPCGAAHNHFHVNWKGEMTPCISFYSVTSSLLESDFETAWNDIRNKMKQYCTPVECLECQYHKFCSSCPAEKCSGILGGKLNTGVCKRMQAYADEGLIGRFQPKDCV